MKVEALVVNNGYFIPSRSGHLLLVHSGNFIISSLGISLDDPRSGLDSSAQPCKLNRVLGPAFMSSLGPYL